MIERDRGSKEVCSNGGAKKFVRMEGEKKFVRMEEQRSLFESGHCDLKSFQIEHFK